MSASISPAVQAAYYLNGEPYYIFGSNGVGEWYGSAAEQLGYAGPVVAEQLHHAFAGLSADGVSSLVQVQSGKTRQAAWDVTMSAPKCVSVLWSRVNAAQRQQVEQIVLKATKRALDYIDAEALKTRRRSAGSLIEAAAGVYALFPHCTSRALDPQLHVHAVVFNLCLRHDGTTGTIRSRDLYWHKMAAGALFRAELAYLLSTELGLTITPNGWKFGIQGVPEELCREFSKRRKEIERLASEGGWSSPEVLAHLAIASREAKKSTPLADCFVNWGAISDAHGFTAKAAQSLLKAGASERSERERLATAASSPLAAVSGNSAESTRRHKESQLIGAFIQSVEALGAFKAHFPARDLVRETAVRGLACGASATEILDTVAQGVRRFENVVLKERSNYASFATKQNIAAERELLQRAAKARDATEHLITPKVVNVAIAKCERKLSKQLGIPIQLTADQKAAIRHVTEEPGRLKLVQGYAGTGKTQLLEAALGAWAASGYRVLGTAITGRAALGLEKSTGIPSLTIELLLRRLRPQLTAYETAKLLAWKGKAVIDSLYYDGVTAGRWLRHPVKEAIRESTSALVQPMTGGRELRRRIDCKLTANTILVVDEAAMLPTATLLALQQECDRAGTKMVLVGDALQLPAILSGGPFSSLAARLGQSQLTTVVRQKQDWMREATSLLIADQPQQALECYAANGALHIARHHRAAMEKLIADYGSLEADKFAKAIALTATNEESRLINGGVQAKRKAARQLGRCSVRLPNGERAYTGDRVMLTRNDYRLDVRNGLLATVVSVSHPHGLARPPALTLRLDDHPEKGFMLPKLRTVTVELQKYPHVQLGYSATAHKIQGVTVETSFVLIGDVMLSKERAFTQLTRASHDTRVYAAEAHCGDHLKHVAQQISRSTAKDLAHDHQIVSQSQDRTTRKNTSLREATRRLTSSDSLVQSHSCSDATTSARLSSVQLTASHIGALWSLVADYGKLNPSQLPSTIAIVAEPLEGKHINRAIQQKRRATQQLGIDSMPLPNGERVYQGDRVLVLHDVQGGPPRSQLGTVTALHFGLRNPADVKITIACDAREHHAAAEMLAIPVHDFPKLQLGYATTAEKIAQGSVDSSFVLLPEGGRTPEPLATLLDCASKNVSLYGVEAYYGRLLGAGPNERSIVEELLGRVPCPQMNETMQDANSHKEVEQQECVEEQSRLQRVNDEQLQLSWQQSFSL